ncbi:MAG: class II aldolase/adducin family protein, partial [Planctomycetota bacterium]
MTASPWSDEETRLRTAICRVGKLSYDRSYIVGADGNISAKMSDGSILITPTGAMKGFLEPHHVAHIDATGRALDDGPRPS